MSTSPKSHRNTTPSCSLAALQLAMSDYLLTGTLVPIEQQVKNHGELKAAQRLHIYHNAYRMRLLGVLQDHFEQTLAYMGDTFFESEALAYIQAHPPETDNLRHYGQRWPQWLAERYPQDLDMADLSRLEWALRDAFDAADTPVATWENLSVLAPEDWARLGFELAAGTQVLSFSHAVLPLWQALVATQTPEPVAACHQDVLIWRRDGQPHFRSLHTEEADALRALLNGERFEQACQGALRQMPPEDAARQAGQWLHQWVDDAVLATPIL